MNRSFTARLSSRTPRRLKDYLWGTHRLFNESLPYLLKHYFWMQNLTDRESADDQRNKLRQRFEDEQLERLRLVYRDMMGLDLPKDKRAGRSQSAQAWIEPITFSPGSTGEGPGEDSKNIQAAAKEAIRSIRKANRWLFDRELALPSSPDNGFRRGLFGSAARRILNFEQNEETHREYLRDAQAAFERWTAGRQRDSASEDDDASTRSGWKRTVLTRAWTKSQGTQRATEHAEIAGLTWAAFEEARLAFAAEEHRRAEIRARDLGMPVDEKRVERINAGMTRGWRDIYERLLPPEAESAPNREVAERIIKDYQLSEPRRIGDINLFLWLADKPHLWRFVETMRRYNDFQRRLEQYSRPIQFRYPRYNQRPEWFSFSETSPGHMYTIVSMHPFIIELCVFAPLEDLPALKKLAKGQALTDQEIALMEQPLDWGKYTLTPARLRARREEYLADLEKSNRRIRPQTGLNEVHDWTDNVWQTLMQGFFRHDAPLDLSRFRRVMVRYTMAADARLGPVVREPVSEKDLIGRLIVESDQREKRHWQGKYRFMFGPLTSAGDAPSERRRLMRPMPLTVGGIRLEYRGRLQPHADPIFTLSCELEEKIQGADGKMERPAPKHRIPNKETREEGALTTDGSRRKGRASGKRRRLPVGLRILSIDLGLRHIATGAVIEFVDDGKGIGVLPTPFKPAAVEFMDVGGISLNHIQRHQDERRRKQRKACPRGSRGRFEIRGSHLPRGQGFASQLLDHVENLKDDRRKKAAHAIVRAALNHHVDYIVFENLAGYRPDCEFGHHVNASLMTWNRRELVEFVRMEAAPLGIYAYDWVPPHHTSRFCHRCGGVGCRFTQISRVDEAKDRLGPEEFAINKDGTPVLNAKGKPVLRHRWTPQARRVRGTPLGLVAGARLAIDGGKHFCCTECGLMVNADYNAAMNLARKLADDFPAYARYEYNPDDKTWLVDGKRLDSKAFWNRARALAQVRLNVSFHQAEDTPPAGGWPEDFAPAAPDNPF